MMERKVSRMWKSGRGIAALAAVLAVAGWGLKPGVFAAEAEASRPSGEEVLARHVEASGGVEARAAMKNRRMKGSMQIQPQGLTFTITAYHARPQKVRYVMESETMGRIDRGTDGRVVWEINSMMGPQVKEGEERAVILRGARFDPDTDWRADYASAECIGDSEVDGRACWVVVMTPKEGRSSEKRYYAKDSGLLVKAEMELELPFDRTPLATEFGDYREVDGVLMAHRIHQNVGDLQEVVFEVQNIEHNVEIAAERFELPAEIKAIVEQ